MTEVRRSPAPAACMVLAAFLIVTRATADAACNIVPAAEKIFPSTLGSVDDPIALQLSDKPVTVRLNPACDPSPGFLAEQEDGPPTVTVTFEPPGGGPMTDVPVPPSEVQVDDALTLRFTIDTAGLAPYGLAGPARIRVHSPTSQTLLAEIGPLFQPTTTCDRQAEVVFQTFTVLPQLNVMADLSDGTATQIFATLDGSGSLLIPFDHLLVLPEGPSAPVARFLSGSTGIDAFLDQPGVQVIDIPNQSFVRAFTPDGRSLPPLLRVDDVGAALFGTADAEASVIRVARTMGGPDIFDFTDRFHGGTGPIVIDKLADGFTVTSGPAVPLAGLASSADVVAFARDESAEGTNLNLSSGDGDQTDHVVEMFNVGTGASIPTEKAVVSVTTGPFSVPSIVVGGTFTAFLESEADQNNTPQNGDGDTNDGILRVYDAAGTELTDAPFPNLAVSSQRMINDRELAISGPLAFFRSPRSLTSVGGSVDDARNAREIAVSPDGKHVVAASSPVGGNQVRVLTRDPQSGLVTLADTEQDGVGGVNGLGGATAVTVSPDGMHVYVAGSTDNAVAAFALNPGTGALTFIEAEVNGVNGVNGLLGANDVEISPDGKHVYVAAAGQQKIGVFSRDNATGALTFIQDPDAPFPFGDLVVSPDGRNVYSANGTGIGIVTYARDPNSGQLTLLDMQTFGSPLCQNIAVSPDGAHVYGAFDAIGDSGILVLSRDPATGALAFASSVSVAGDGSPIAGGIVVSPDGNHVYVVGVPTFTLTLYSRNASDGSLTALQPLAVPSAFALGLSPGEGHVYLGRANGSGMLIYANNGPLLEAFDTGASDLRPGLGIRAGSVAVAGLHAAALTSEEDGTVATDLNNDTDTSDQVAQLHERVSDTVTPLGLAANRIALSNQLLAMTVPEGSQGNAVRNNDGDTADDVLAIQAVPLGGPPAPVNVGVAADAIAVNGSTVVFTTPESAEGPGGVQCTATVPPGGCDLNGDGDADDRVIRRYAAGAVRQIRYAAEDFVTAGSLIAFRTSEAAQSNAPPPACSLNGDADCDDAVMFVHDLATNVVVPTGQAAIPCTLPGCDPFQPYKVQGELVSFITREIDQGPDGIGCKETVPPGGCDLDGDAADDDTVLQVFNVRTRRLTIVDLGEDCETTQITRFVTTYIDGTIVYVRKSESEMGRDLNGDGDQDDCADLLMSDVDEDGTFEDEDVCEATQDPDQQDSDLDGIGNLCDANAFCSAFVPEAPPAAPGGSAGCQKALGKAAAVYLKKRAKAEQRCLDDVASGDVEGHPSVLCRGTFVSGGEIPPSDAKTAADIVKAGEKFAVKVARGCTDLDLAPLEACADTLGGLPACIFPAYGASAAAATEEAYGVGGPVVDDDARRCQSAVGKASANYLVAVTKAVQGCFDKVNRGLIGGDPQPLCLGSQTSAGLVLPTETGTARKLAAADNRLRAAIARRCAGGELAQLASCGSDPTSAADCLACTHWRYAFEAIRSSYGP